MKNNKYSKYIPTYCIKSVFDLDYNKLYELGKKIILTDLDNTLISYKTTFANKELQDLNKELRKLGFKILRENHRQDRADIKLDLQFGDQELEIFVNPSAPKRPNYPEALGLRHLAFKVKDIDEAVSWLNERGIETEPIRFDVFTQNRMTFFKDPDGLPLEIHE